MRPLRNIFYKLSRTEQRREGVAAYLWDRHSGTLGIYVQYFVVHKNIFHSAGFSLELAAHKKNTHPVTIGYIRQVPHMNHQSTKCCTQ